VSITRRVPGVAGSRRSSAVFGQRRAPPPGRSAGGSSAPAAPPRTPARLAPRSPVGGARH